MDPFCIPARTHRKPPGVRKIAALLLTAVLCGTSALSQTGAEAREGLSEQLGALRQELAAAAGDYRRSVPPGSLPRPSAGIAEARCALAMLQVEKAFDYLGDVISDRGSAESALTAAKTIWTGDNSQKTLETVRYGRLVEQAYFARNDGSPQPYYLFRPTAGKPGKRLPLVVFLHGYVPETSRTRPYLASDFVLDLAEKHNCLFVIPHGRTNTDFQFAGEVDVLRVIAEIKRFCHVDDSRIYLLGVSMGGAGVWHLATHYPDRFAAVAPINAQGDWFRFWTELFNYPPREKLPEHIQFLVAMNNPLDLAGNMANLYSYSQHASRCFVGPAHTRAMVAVLRKVGAPHEFFEDPSELGHYIYWRPDCWSRAFDHLVKHKKKAAMPSRIRYSTYSLRFPGAYWARVVAIEEWGKIATIDAEVSQRATLTLKTENVGAITLTPPREWLGEDGTFAVDWNGETLGKKGLDADGAIQLMLHGQGSQNERPAAKVSKSTGVCGPAADVFNFPFLIVRGTQGGPDIQQANAALAEQIAEDWFSYAEGKARIMRDTQVKKQHMRDYGLVLVGFPDENTVLGKFADSFPIKINAHSISLPDGKSYPRRGHGLIMTYPNPRFPQRYVLVYAGLRWGSGRSPNHRFDCIPDFTIYSKETVAPAGYNRYLAAGFFDSDWLYRPELTDFGVDASAGPPEDRE